MIASNYYTEKQDDNIIEVPEFGLKLLKSAVIYGANASGKSKLFEAMSFVRKLIISSHGNLIGDSIGVEPFRLSTETENEPSVFEFIFIYKKQIYRYGFETTTEKIVAEWLYRRVKTKEIELFYRDNQAFELNAAIFPVDDLVARKRIRPNALLLSVAANGNDSIAVEVLEWIRGGCNVLSGLQEQNYMGYSIRKLKDPKMKNQILNLMQIADLSIDDLIPKILKINDLPDGIPDELKEVLTKRIEEKNDDAFSGVSTFHKKFNEGKTTFELIKFTMKDEESAGTGKYFALMGPIIDTLNKGAIIIIDELDAKLHPNLTHQIIELFNCKTKNPHNAQLIFNTHDTNLLDADLFRRDQIWFTEKDRYGAANLYSLSEIKGVRKDDPLEKNYIAGKYGAIPFLGSTDNLFND